MRRRSSAFSVRRCSSSSEDTVVKIRPGCALASRSPSNDRDRSTPWYSSSRRDAPPRSARRGDHAPPSGVGDRRPLVWDPQLRPQLDGVGWLDEAPDPVGEVAIVAGDTLVGEWERRGDEVAARLLGQGADRVVLPVGWSDRVLRGSQALVSRTRAPHTGGARHRATSLTTGSARMRPISPTRGCTARPLLPSDPLARRGTRMAEEPARRPGPTRRRLLSSAGTAVRGRRVPRRKHRCRALAVERLTIRRCSTCRSYDEPQHRGRSMRKRRHRSASSCWATPRGARDGPCRRGAHRAANRSLPARWFGRRRCHSKSGGGGIDTSAGTVERGTAFRDMAGTPLLVRPARPPARPFDRLPGPRATIGDGISALVPRGFHGRRRAVAALASLDLTAKLVDRRRLLSLRRCSTWSATSPASRVLVMSSRRLRQAVDEGGVAHSTIAHPTHREPGGRRLPLRPTASSSPPHCAW